MLIGEEHFADGSSSRRQIGKEIHGGGGAGELEIASSDGLKYIMVLYTYVFRILRLEIRVTRYPVK